MSIKSVMSIRSVIDEYQKYHRVPLSVMSIMSVIDEHESVIEYH